MLITIYKCLNYESFAKYLKDMHMLTLRQSVCSSRRANILSLCKPATTTYMASTLFVALHLRNGTPYLIM